MKSTVWFLIISFFCLTSCGDCLREANGVVLKKGTITPVDSALVTIMKGNNVSKIKTYTDKNGKFYLSDISRGVFKCPDMKVTLEKDGYKTMNIVIPNNTNTETIIYIEKK